MASVEGPRGLQQNKLTSVVNAPDWDFRKANRWVNRYFREYKHKWDERSDALVGEITNHPEDSYRLFEYAAPADKFKLIELVSYFGTREENATVASTLLASAMSQYSNPDGLSVNEQFEFFYDKDMHLEIKPSILLEGINIYFDSLRNDRFHEENMVSLELRRNREMPSVRPSFETHFMRRSLNTAIVKHREGKGTDMEMFKAHFEMNKDMYEHFGLVYEENEKRVRAFYDPIPEPKTSQ